MDSCSCEIVGLIVFSSLRMIVIAFVKGLLSSMLLLG